MERSYGIEAGNLVREFEKGPRAMGGVSLPVSPGEVQAPIPVPLNLLEGWRRAAAPLNPLAVIATTGRSLLAGDPTGVPAAFIIGVSPIAVFLAWAYFGLRSADRPG